MVVEISFGIRLDLLGHLRFPETSITIKMSKARDFTDLRDIVLYFQSRGPDQLKSKLVILSFNNHADNMLRFLYNEVVSKCNLLEPRTWSYLTSYYIKTTKR